MPIFNSKNLFYQRKEGFLYPHERQKIISPTFYWSWKKKKSFTSSKEFLP